MRFLLNGFAVYGPGGGHFFVTPVTIASVDILKRIPRASRDLSARKLAVILERVIPNLHGIACLVSLLAV